MTMHRAAQRVAFSRDKIAFRCFFSFHFFGFQRIPDNAETPSNRCFTFSEMASNGGDCVENFKKSSANLRTSSNIWRTPISWFENSFGSAPARSPMPIFCRYFRVCFSNVRPYIHRLRSHAICSLCRHDCTLLSSVFPLPFPLPRKFK